MQRWINAYTSGDYVGRWLWSRPPLPKGDRSNTIIDELVRRYDVYRAPADVAALRAQLQDCAQLDVCLGAGAHTHYFEPEQGLVAAIVDELIAAPWPPAVAPAASG